MNVICAKGHTFDNQKYPNRCPICGLPPNKPAETFGGNKNFGAVVGWLVCIRGSQKGKDFRIKPEINLLGSSEEMDICITGDDAISDRKHAVISYDVDNRDFYLIPGEGKLVYHQEKEIQRACLLYDYDEIRIGNSRFVFRSFCNKDNFDWNE